MVLYLELYFKNVYVSGNHCSEDPKYYAPGTGLSWEVAWIEIDPKSLPNQSILMDPTLDQCTGVIEGQYILNKVYQTHDLVFDQNQCFRCKQPRRCSSSVYAPNAVFGDLAWEVIPNCYLHPRLSMEVDCYETGNFYNAGSKVQVDDQIYQCKTGQASAWCMQGGFYYAPGYGLFWQSAWELV